MLLVDAHLSRALQMPSHQRIGQQLFLVHDTELKWQIRIKNWDVERRAVIDGVNVRLREVNLLEADDAHRRKYGLHDGLRPGMRKPVQNAAIFVEEPEGNGSDAEGYGVGRGRVCPNRDCSAVSCPLCRASVTLLFSIGMDSEDAHGFADHVN